MCVRCAAATRVNQSVKQGLVEILRPRALTILARAGVCLMCAEAVADKATAVIVSYNARCQALGSDARFLRRM